MQETDVSYDEQVTELRLYYAHYLKAAKAILLGESVDKDDRELVRGLSLDKKWFYRHCPSPCDSFGEEPNGEMAFAMERYGDSRYENGVSDASIGDSEFSADDDDGSGTFLLYQDSCLRHSRYAEEMRAFGITGENVRDDEFIIANQFGTADQ